MAYTKPEKGDKADAPMRRRPNRRRRKECAFCADKEHTTIDYKDVNKLKRYISERGKIYFIARYFARGVDYIFISKARSQRSEIVRFERSQFFGGRERISPAGELISEVFAEPADYTLYSRYIIILRDNKRAERLPLVLF